MVYSDIREAIYHLGKFSCVLLFCDVNLDWGIWVGISIFPLVVAVVVMDVIDLKICADSTLSPFFVVLFFLLCFLGSFCSLRSPFSVFGVLVDRLATLRNRARP